MSFMGLNTKNIVVLLLVTGLAVLSSDMAQASTLGAVINRVNLDTAFSLPGLLGGFSYLMGLIMGFTGIMKLKEHVESPNQVQIYEPIKRFIAGGAFFALPFVADVIRETIEGNGV